MSLVISLSDTTIWIVSILTVLYMSLTLIYLFKEIRIKITLFLFWRMLSKSSCIIMMLSVFKLYFSQVSYKDTLNLFLHLMFLLHLHFLLLLTVRKYKLLMTVKVLVAHLLEYLLDPRIRKLRKKNCDQTNIILNEEYIFFRYIWGFKELGQIL